MNGIINFHDLERVNLKASDLEKWVFKIAEEFNRPVLEIQYVFCDDEYLYEMNMQYLNHDTYTDIITFDYGDGKELHGDLFISVERVSENAKERGLSVEEELLRVMAHGLLHMQGFKDKSDEERATMRKEEERLMKLFHVEH